MAISSNGKRCGTIGGGVMEVNWAEEASKALNDGAAIVRVRRIFHSRESQFEQSGLICSGSQTMLATIIDSSHSGTIDRIIKLYEEKLFGKLSITPDSVSLEPLQRNPRDTVFRFVQENNWTYEENCGILDTVYILGSGHVGLALSRVMATLDFHVVVIDERSALETFVMNSYAHVKHSVRYEQSGPLIVADGRAYVAVVTTAYESDERALRALLDKNPRYIGVMGSPAKTRKIFDDLRSQGVPDDSLKRIHSPIGVQIASHTPEEIAISIAAEIIKTRNTPTP